jgi:transposase-like protein
VDEVVPFRRAHKRYLYRAIDEDDVVIDVPLREHRDTASAEAFFQ